MSATTNHSVTRVFLPAVVLGVLFSLMLSSSALAMRVYEGHASRHASARQHLKAKKFRTHRRVRARAAAAVGFNLCAKPGSVTPAGAPGSIQIWGFATGSCASATAGIPGPNLSVNEGDVVTLNIENALPHDLKIDVPGITFTPTAGDSPNIPAGTTGHVRFTASNPGTFLYESHGDAGRQSLVGLAGALIVRPLTAGRAYDDASTAYNTEAIMVLSEIDPALHATLPSPESFDMATYAPKYRLINGLAYPATGTIPATSNSKVILRYVNAGSQHASMTLLGTDATVVGRDGSFLTTPLGVTADTIPSGGTSDEIVQIPAGSSGKKFAIYDRNLALVNDSAAGLGGRVRFIQVP